MSIYNYDKKFFNKSIEKWCEDVHNELSKRNENVFDLFTLTDYGIDLYKKILVNVLCYIENNKNEITKFTKNKINKDKYIHIIHSSYIEHFYIWTLQTGEHYNYDNTLATTSVYDLDENMNFVYNEIIESIFSVIIELMISNSLKNINFN